MVKIRLLLFVLFSLIPILLIVTLFSNNLGLNSGSSESLGTLRNLSGLTSVKRKNLVTVILGGDVMLGRSVMAVSSDKGDALYPFRKISAYLSTADAVLFNLENPIIENCPINYQGMVFCAHPQMLQGLVASSVNIVNIANNHILDYGFDGYEETKKHLEENGILYFGGNDYLVYEFSGLKFGFVGFNKAQIMKPSLTQDERKLIISVRKMADVLIVSMHWGVEYQPRALPGIKKLAHELAELGADVVWGHHPHWVQNVERIGESSVFYSLGNLVFDQMWSEETREGIMVKLVFEDGRIVKEEFIKTYMKEWAQPELVDDK